jgi:hypothetical protein
VFYFQAYKWIHFEKTHTGGKFSGFACGLFNKAVHVSDYEVLNYETISENELDRMWKEADVA